MAWRRPARGWLGRLFGGGLLLGACGYAVGAVGVAVPALVSDEVLEPSVLNEVRHALAVAATNAATNAVAARDFVAYYATNGMDATRRAIDLVSSQREGAWHWRGTNVTPVAVRILRETAGLEEDGGSRR